MTKKKTKQTVLEDDTITDLREQYPSNSKASKVAPLRDEQPTEDQIEVDEFNIEEKQQKKTRKANIRKRSLAQSVAHTFFGDEAKNTLEYILNDVLIPAAKNTIQEMVQSGIEMILFGETRPSSRRDKDRGKTIVSYGSYFKSKGNDDRRERHYNRRDRFGLGDIYFDTPKEANDVLSDLCDLLDQYEWVTVADYFDIAGIDDESWINNKWGWNDLGRAKCVHVRGGYAVVLPDPVELD